MHVDAHSPQWAEWQQRKKYMTLLIKQSENARLELDSVNRYKYRWASSALNVYSKFERFFFVLVHRFLCCLAALALVWLGYWASTVEYKKVFGYKWNEWNVHQQQRIGKTKQNRIRTKLTRIIDKCGQIWWLQRARKVWDRCIRQQRDSRFLLARACVCVCSMCALPSGPQVIAIISLIRSSTCAFMRTLLSFVHNFYLSPKINVSDCVVTVTHGFICMSGASFPMILAICACSAGYSAFPYKRNCAKESNRTGILQPKHTGCNSTPIEW